MIVLELDIENLEAAAADIHQLAVSQVPYATSLALNATMRDIRRHVIGVTWQKAFTVRNRAFPGTLFRIKFSRKGDLEAVLYDRLGREYLERHATGGIKTSETGGNLAIPINVPRTATGRVVAAKKPAALGRKRSTRVVTGKNGRRLIIESFKGETIVRYVIAPSARIDKSFRVYEDAVKVFDRVFSGHWNTGLQRAARTMRVLTPT